MSVSVIAIVVVSATRYIRLSKIDSAVGFLASTYISLSQFVRLTRCPFNRYLYALLKVMVWGVSPLFLVLCVSHKF